MAAEAVSSSRGTVDYDRPYMRFIDIFGLREENSTLRFYMSLRDTNLIAPQVLMQYSSGLALSESEHPLMGYASAWAAAGAALHNGSIVGAEFSQDARLEALEFARVMWQRSATQFEEASHLETGERRARLLDLSYRSEEAVACLPNMQLAALWNSGTEVPEIAIEIAHFQTKNNLLKLLMRMRNSNDSATRTDEDEEILKRKKGLQDEILGILLPQEDLRRQVIVYPASLQQDHNADPWLRADLVAVDTSIGHSSGLVQVTAALWKNKFISGTRMFICAGIDLALVAGESTDATVDALLDREKGELKDIGKKNKLIKLSTGLSDMMQLFLREPSADQIPTLRAFVGHR